MPDPTISFPADLSGMAEVCFGKTLPVLCSGDLLLDNLQDPLFWSFLPGTFRKLEIERRPLALGDSIKPGFDTFRLASVAPGSVTFQLGQISATLLATPGVPQIGIELRVFDANCEAAAKIQALADVLTDGGKLLAKQPHLALLPTIRDFSFEERERKTRIHGHIRLTMDLPCTVAQFEQTLLDPNTYPEWMDPDHAGALRVDPNWPEHGSLVRYRYKTKIHKFEPFRWWNSGTIRIAGHQPGRNISIEECSSPGGEEIHLHYAYWPTAEGITVTLDQDSIVRGAWARRILGGSIWRIIPTECAETFCRLARWVRRSAPAPAESAPSVQEKTAPDREPAPVG